MADPLLQLWWDVESTGLLTDTVTPTVLESAHLVTAIDGTQLTPLRQRYTALPTGADDIRTPAVRRASADGAPEVWSGHWLDSRPGGEGGYPHSAVVEMHDRNGLTDEWATVAATRPSTIYREWAELERLILDDLAFAARPFGGFDALQSGQVVLAGGGTSHYEHLFGAEQMRRLFRVRGPMHYGDADLSVVLRVLAMRFGLDITKADHLIAFAHTVDARDWAYLEIEAARAGGPSVDFAPSQWNTDERDPHRAAPGIARALFGYRLLPLLISPNGAKRPAAPES
jgi:hypothetical protein